ncbi:MAG TPA: nucleotidyltransferase family protein [Bacilli bacterium]|nr:nucleotidyltransferase family protein [Bacilli bacterium]HOR53208.1 nucleotidyltransferase family protein [Bacilli bacterium]
MKILGVILELNPPHNAHKYFIEKAKIQVQPDLTIAIISCNFAQRGEISIISKYEKTKAALNLGADLVIELPVFATLNSAELFGYYAVKILNDFKITDLAFGVELDDLNLLKKTNEILESPSYNEKLKANLNHGYSYKKAALLAFEKSTDNPILTKNFNKPNNTLALKYLSAIDKINPKLQVNLIKRIGENEYSKNIGEYPSGSTIRNLISKGKDVSKFIPAKYNFINYNQAYDNLFYLFKSFILLEKNPFKNTKHIKEGIENRIYKILKETFNYKGFISKMKTKRYSENYLQRLLLSVLLELENQDDYYLRVLGFNKKGEKHLSNIDKPIITSPKNINNKLLNIELKASKLYALITNNDNYYQEEFLIPYKENK